MKKTDKEIWEESFSNKEVIKDFEIKSGPPLTKEQVEVIKQRREKEKEKKFLESLQNHIKILEEELNKVKKVYKRISSIKNKPQTVIENNESKVTKKQTE